MLLPVILSGGAGTRLWPLSRELYPKQLLALIGERTMLQETALRLAGLDAGAPVVVCNEAHRFLVAEQLRQLEHRAAGDRARALRPQHRAGHRAGRARRTTAAARGRRSGAAGAARRPRHARRRGVPEGGAHGVARGERGKLVTFGIVPRAPETGYGYIQRGEADGAAPIASRSSSRSQPASARRQFLASGDHYWNSGMFMFRAQPLPRGARAVRAGHRAGVPRGTATARRRISISRASMPRHSRRARATRSTTR